MRDYGCAGRLEYRISVVVVGMEMRVHHPFNGLVGDLADAIEQVLPIARVLTRIDDQHALVGDQERGV